MKILRELTNFEPGSIGSPWSWKKMSWTPISMRRFQFQGDEAKDLHKTKLVMEKRIIADSIKDHLIPQVSSLKTPRDMFDALTKLFEGKNINRKMTLRNKLKNVKSRMQRPSSITLQGSLRSRNRWKQ